MPSIPARGDVANNSGAGLSIADSTFTGNKAVENGGAIRNSFYTSLENANAVTIVQTTFTDNTAGRKGGAIYNDSQVDKVNNYASMAIADSTFTGNHADEAEARFTIRQIPRWLYPETITFQAIRQEPVTI